MKRKGIIISLCVIAFITISIIIYIIAGTKRAKNLMWEYLDKKGCSQTEIQSIDVSHSFFSKLLSYNEWNISIVYSDEPTSIYDYSVKDNAIVESGVSGTTEKDDLKH